MEYGRVIFNASTMKQIVTHKFPFFVERLIRVADLWSLPLSVPVH